MMKAGTTFEEFLTAMPRDPATGRLRNITFDNAAGVVGRNPYRFTYGTRADGGGGSGKRGKRRSTELESARDLWNYVNGNPEVLIHADRPGRPDMLVDEKGNIHSYDLPGKPTSGKPKTGKRGAPERDFHVALRNSQACVKRLSKLPNAVVEVKASTKAYDIKTAVGQLNYDRFDSKIDGPKVLFVPKQPSEKLVSFIESEGITLIVGEDVLA
jgi:hypothetical protein